MKRFEKIEKLKKKWTTKNQTETSKQEEEIRKTITTEDTWSVWRKREKEEQEENTQEITKNILENEITTIITKKVRINLPKITIKDKQDYVISEQKLSSHQDEGQSSSSTSPQVLKMTLRPPNKKDNPKNKKQTRKEKDDLKTTTT